MLAAMRCNPALSGFRTLLESMHLIASLFWRDSMFAAKPPHRFWLGEHLPNSADELYRYM